MIWVVGARGLLGREVCRALDESGLPWIGTDKECDVADARALARFATSRNPAWIVNCSGYTAVDLAEDEEDLATRINVSGPANLGRLAQELGARIIHLSTDYVFAGDASSPYQETATPCPLCIYGRTKALGEEALSRVANDIFILRTAWLYGAGGSNFVLTMLKLMRECGDVRVVSDQRGSPTFAYDLAAAIRRLIERDSREFGLYHCTNLGETTWYGFAQEIHRLAVARGILPGGCRITPVSTGEYPRRAKRPVYSVLDTRKLREVMGIVLPSWQDALQRFFDELAQKSGGGA